MLRRGPFVIAAGLDESVPNAKPYVLRGRFIDLFDSSLPILSSVSVTPGKRILLFDLNATPAGANPSVIAAACRIREQTASAEKLSFLVDGIENTQAVVRIHARRGQIGRSRRLRPRSGYIAFAFHQLGAAGANRN